MVRASVTLLALAWILEIASGNHATSVMAINGAVALCQAITTELSAPAMR